MSAREGVTQTGLDGAFLIDRPVYSDARGYFREVWREATYRELGITLPFVQDNVSRSVRGAIRGLHAQRAPHEQGKLITVLSGSVWDAIVDIRPESPTFRQVASFELSSETGRQLWLPPGFLHGFQALTDDVVVHYKCTAYHSADHEIAVRFSDSALNISWPIADAIVSSKDSDAPLLHEVLISPGVIDR
jgi:dTDP-4-dehydrorhamnose 3,5-epimerase